MLFRSDAATELLKFLRKGRVWARSISRESRAHGIHSENAHAKGEGPPTSTAQSRTRIGWPVFRAGRAWEIRMGDFGRSSELLALSRPPFRARGANRRGRSGGEGDGRRGGREGGRAGWEMEERSDRSCVKIEKRWDRRGEERKRGTNVDGLAQGEAREGRGR